MYVHRLVVTRAIRVSRESLGVTTNRERAGPLCAIHSQVASFNEADELSEAVAITPYVTSLVPRSHFLTTLTSMEVRRGTWRLNFRYETIQLPANTSRFWLHRVTTYKVTSLEPFPRFLGKRGVEFQPHFALRFRGIRKSSSS